MQESSRQIARQIIAFHAELASKADGEWKWINNNRRQDYLSVLDSGDVPRLADILENMFRNDATYGIYSYEGLDVERDVDEWKKSIRVRGRLGTKFGNLPDTARHDYFAEKILDLKPKRILEIGGGYGGLALQLFRRDKNIQYADIDLPETLYLTLFFLKRHGLSVHFSLDGSIQGSITLIPSTVRVHWKPDVVFNCLSLSEMGHETVRTYLRMMNATWKPKYFYHMNSDYNLFPDSERHREFLASDFPVGRNYELQYRIPTRWQGGGYRAREFMYKRK